MKIKIKRLHPNSVIPRYAKHGDAGMDLTATSKIYDENNNVVYGTGLAVEIPEGYVGLVFPRSSICKKDLFLTNSVGVIDSGYRGEIMAKFKHTDNLPVEYRVGERIAQLIIIPHPYIEFELANELSESERGSGGYGSSGR
jgi:dUTP pyrophosphatase